MEHRKAKNGDYTEEGLMYLSVALTELEQYRMSGLSPECVAMLAAAEKEGRILPQGFSCAESCDGVSVYVFHPAGKRVLTEKSDFYMAQK